MVEGITVHQELMVPTVVQEVALQTQEQMVQVTFLMSLQTKEQQVVIQQAILVREVVVQLLLEQTEEQTVEQEEEEQPTLFLVHLLPTRVVAVVVHITMVLLELRVQGVVVSVP